MTRQISYLTVQHHYLGVELAVSTFLTISVLLQPETIRAVMEFCPGTMNAPSWNSSDGGEINAGVNQQHGAGQCRHYTSWVWSGWMC